MEQTVLATSPSLPVPFADPAPEIAALAEAWRRANGPVMSLANRLGGDLEKAHDALPVALRNRIDRITASALETAMSAAAVGDRAPRLGRRGPMAAVLVSGAAGGAGGLATAIAELPVTVTVLLHAIRREAREAGYDPDDPAIRAECLKAFAAGSPLAADDGVNTSFLSARLTLTGPALQKVIATVAPRLGISLGQKLAAQSVPVLGALAGAALNAAYLNYYREIARIRFALLRLSEAHGAAPVLAAFGQAAARPAVARA
jgi:hypothetical protein